MKTDFLGNELNIGDEVVFMQLNYRSLMKGTIVSMAEKQAIIDHQMTNTCRHKTKQFYSQLIKVIK